MPRLNAFIWFTSLCQRLAGDWRESTRALGYADSARRRTLYDARQGSSSSRDVRAALSCAAATSHRAAVSSSCVSTGDGVGAAAALPAGSALDASSALTAAAALTSASLAAPCTCAI